MISTARYAQGTEPLYWRAVGRWERYQRHLVPVFNVLQPWVEQFDYGMC
ncbi:hypothetical protein [Sphingomonas sp. 22176]